MKNNKIKIVINGRNNIVEHNTTLLQLINKLGIDKKKIAIELNTEIIPKSSYSKKLLLDGDVIEIVHFIGGG